MPYVSPSLYTREVSEIESCIAKSYRMVFQGDRRVGMLNEGKSGLADVGAL